MVKYKNENLKTNYIAAFLYLLSAECDWHMRGEFSLKYKYAIERTAHTDLTDSDRISTYDMT